MDVACSGRSEPVTVVSVAPAEGRPATNYVVRRPDGSEVRFRVPDVYPPCGRPAVTFRALGDGGALTGVTCPPNRARRERAPALSRG
jgi:hypothetical protein